MVTYSAVPGPGKLLRGRSVTKFGIGKELGTGAGRWCGVPDRWSPLPVSRLQPRGAHSRTCPSSAPGAFPPWGRARGPAASSSILCLSRLVLAWAIRSSVKQDWGSDARVLQQLGREVANKEILQQSDPAAGHTRSGQSPTSVQKPHPGCPCRAATCGGRAAHPTASPLPTRVRCGGARSPVSRGIFTTNTGKEEGK